jgi:hypothetical protein
MALPVSGPEVGNALYDIVLKGYVMARILLQVSIDMQQGFFVDASEIWILLDLYT